MKKIFGYSAFVAGLLVLTAGVLLLYRLSQFRAEVKRLKAEGQPVAIADLNRPASEEGQQALLLFNRLQASLSKFEAEMFVDEEVLNRPVDDEMVARLEQLSAAYPDVYPLIDQLTQKSEIAIELEGHSQEYIDQLLDRVQQFRSTARVLAWKVRILAAQQKPDQAVVTGLKIFGLSRLVNQHPTIVSHLVGIAMRQIAIDAIHEVIVNHKISDQTRTQLNQELELQDSTDAYLTSLKSERPIGIEMLSEMGIVNMARNGNGYLELVEDEIRNAEKESYQQDYVVESSYSSWIDGAIGESLLPAFQQSRLAAARIRSLIRALRIINALEGQPAGIPTPVTQEYLIEIGVPKKMTIDTMNGEPMKVKRQNDCWIVYSVGRNLIDDGGSNNPIEDFCLGAESSQ